MTLTCVVVMLIKVILIQKITCLSCPALHFQFYISFVSHSYECMVGCRHEVSHGLMLKHCAS